MIDLLQPIVAALFLWWFSTGAIFYLCGAGGPSRSAGMMIGVGVLVVSLAAVTQVGAAGPMDAYIAFACGLGVWAWIEIGFLLGIVTGPRRTACPASATGLRRFGFGFAALAYHEIAIALGALALWTFTAGGDNQVALWTYLVLWAMRISAKLNVFLGVPNMTHEFTPPRLVYLESYFRRGPLNPLFPLLVSGATIAATMLAMAAFSAPRGSFEGVGLTLVATLLSLAILEHWFLALPVEDAALWRWFVARREGRSRRKDAQAATAL